MSTRSSTEKVSQADDKWMARALELARRGIALAHPNPVVGAVLVKGQRVIGEGFHAYDNRDHAEILALNEAGTKARGATLYVTLEPCCITGRTGPCTKAIIAAEVKRVVAAMKDPNPAVAGRGFAELKRAADLPCTSGATKQPRAAMNEDFAKWIRTGQPFVTLKTALTLDGKIAAREGSTTWITSEASREEVQRIRHAADALAHRNRHGAGRRSAHERPHGQAAQAKTDARCGRFAAAPAAEIDTRKVGGRRCDGFHVAAARFAQAARALERAGVRSGAGSRRAADAWICGP